MSSAVLSSSRCHQHLLPLAVTVLLVLLSVAVSTSDASSFMPSEAKRSRESDWNRDCILLCHAECSVWKGYDLKHCTRQCMAAGIANFQHEFCLNMGGKKRAGGAADLLRKYAYLRGLQD